jgi:hypothetical protein
MPVNRWPAKPIVFDLPAGTLAVPTKLGSNESNGTSTIACSPSRDILVGEVIVVTVTQRDWAFTSLADNSAQTGTANTYTKDQQTTALTDPTCYVFSCVVTRKILSTDTITATFAGPNGGKSICVFSLSKADTSAGAAVRDITLAGVSGGGSGSTFSSGASSAIAQANEYAIGVAAVAQASSQPTAITADSPWTLQYSGVAGGGAAYGHAHSTQVLSAIAALTYSGGWGVNTAGVQSVLEVTYKGTP